MATRQHLISTEPRRGVDVGDPNVALSPPVKRNSSEYFNHQIETMALREVEERRRRDWFHGYPAPSRFHTISTPPQIEKEISQYLKDAYPEMNLHEGKDYTIEVVTGPSDHTYPDGKVVTVYSTAARVLVTNHSVAEAQPQVLPEKISYPITGTEVKGTEVKAVWKLMEGNNICYFRSVRPKLQVDTNDFVVSAAFVEAVEIDRSAEHRIAQGTIAQRRAQNHKVSVGIAGASYDRELGRMLHFKRNISTSVREQCRRERMLARV